MDEPNPLRVAFARHHPAELAAFLAAQPHDALLSALHGLPAEVGAGVIARLPHGLAVQLLASQDDDTVSAWLGRADLDDALTLLLHLEESRRGKILATVPIRHVRRTLERLVVYPKKTVGALLDPAVPRVQASANLAQAIDLLRAGAHGDLEWIWIVDDQGRYVGLLDVGRALLSRSAQSPVAELTVRLEALRAETSLVAARDVGDWVKHPELPVVDHQNHLLGALSRERLLKALEHDGPSDHGLVDGLSALTEAYFRVMGACLGDLLGPRSR